MKQWKALYVASRAEKKIAGVLNELGIESFVPLKTELRQWSDRKKRVVVPMINGYVFLHVEPIQRDKALSVRGVLRYVRCNGTDAIIRNNEIEAMKAIQDKGYHVEGRFEESLESGALVTIKHGPFKGLQGLVKERRTETVYTVGISNLGYTLSVTVPREILERES